MQDIALDPRCSRLAAADGQATAVHADQGGLRHLATLNVVEAHDTRIGRHAADAVHVAAHIVLPDQHRSGQPGARHVRLESEPVREDARHAIARRIEIGPVVGRRVHAGMQGEASAQIAVDGEVERQERQLPFVCGLHVLELDTEVFQAGIGIPLDLIGKTQGSVDRGGVLPCLRVGIPLRHQDAALLDHLGTAVEPDAARIDRWRRIERNRDLAAIDEQLPEAAGSIVREHDMPAGCMVPRVLAPRQNVPVAVPAPVRAVDPMGIDVQLVLGCILGIRLENRQAERGGPARIGSKQRQGRRLQLVQPVLTCCRVQGHFTKDFLGNHVCFPIIQLINADENAFANRTIGEERRAGRTPPILVEQAAA
ncbi:hypothetical protein ACFSUI_05640 [Ralstonia solanacearum]